MSPGHDGDPAVSVVVVAFGEERLLQDCVTAILASVGVTVEVVVVDNGCTTDAVDRLSGMSQVEVVRPGLNTGFAGGVNLGVRHTGGDVVVLVNSDAVVEPSAVGALVAALEDRRVGIVTGRVRLADRPERLNCAGNPVHYLGLSWAGGLGEPAADHDERRSVASASGALMGVRRDTWDALGGFFEPMFLYCEDVELSLRCWQRGWRVDYVPAAGAVHAYEFHRNPGKMLLLERNRLLVVLTVYDLRLLISLAVPLVALEVVLLGVACRQGWGGQKLRGWWWLLTHAPLVRRRRVQVQQARAAGDGRWACVLSGTFDPGKDSGFRAPRLLDAAAGAYWRLVLRRISQPSDTGPRPSYA